jgi:hypothetical protein
MRVHLPKPLHGWRAFIGEVGVIVLGVLIALAAGQTVEWLSWQARAAQAEAQMRHDAAGVLDDMLERLDIEQCQDRRLVLIRDRLLSSGARWTPMAPFYTSGPPKGSIYAHPMRGWPRTAWLGAVASTAATHLPDAALGHYAKIFAAADRETNDQTAEHESSSELNVLGAAVALTPEVKVEFLRIVEAERARNRLMAYEARHQLEDFAALGWNLKAADAQARKDSLAYSVCAANRLL